MVATRSLLGVIFLLPRHKSETYMVPCMFRRFQRFGPPLGCLLKGKKFTYARYVIFAFARSSICMNRNTSNKATFPEGDDNKKFKSLATGMFIFSLHYNRTESTSKQYASSYGQDSEGCTRCCSNNSGGCSVI